MHKISHYLCATLAILILTGCPEATPPVLKFVVSGEPALATEMIHGESGETGSAAITAGGNSPNSFQCFQLESKTEDVKFSYKTRTEHTEPALVSDGLPSPAKPDGSHVYAIRINLVGKDADKYELSYGGIEGHAGDIAKSFIDDVKAGQWLEGPGAKKNAAVYWISTLKVKVVRK